MESCLWDFDVRVIRIRNWGREIWSRFSRKAKNTAISNDIKLMTVIARIVGWKKCFPSLHAVNTIYKQRKHLFCYTRHAHLTNLYVNVCHSVLGEDWSQIHFIFLLDVKRESGKFVFRSYRQSSEFVQVKQNVDQRENYWVVVVGIRSVILASACVEENDLLLGNRHRNISSIIPGNDHLPLCVSDE